MLFFIRPLRELAKNHIRSSCFKEPCLTCELGFLFRMLEGANGVNCQASNFLRAFGLIRQGLLKMSVDLHLANALGLLEPEHITAESQIAYGSLIQTFFRFLLEQIYQEAAGPSISIESDKLLPRLFRIPLLSISCCNSNSSHQHEREISPFIIDLSYPRNV
jgi:PAB-dependent poly(A)-specific ribonuclease subunit 2